MLQLKTQLIRWQRREWLVRLAWGGARFAAITLGVLTLACLVDWVIDRRMDTPWWLRIGMTVAQLGLAAVLVVRLLGRLHVPSIDALAGRAEAAIPEFDHRLVTALQLNRPTAQTAGMSPQLIEEVTREAETLSQRHNLPALADFSRLEKAAMLAGPLLIAALAFAVLRPTLSAILLQRQALQDVDIPRSVMLENATPALLPAGDPVRVLYRVRGEYSEASIGRVSVTPDGMPVEHYALKFDSKLDSDTAIFVAEVPATSTPMALRARLADGRTRTASRIEFAARPVVSEISARLLLPAYVDPEGKRRFERHQPQAEVTALPDCGLSVSAAFSKAVVKAEVVLYQRVEGKPEAELARFSMTLDDTARRGTGVIGTLPNNAVAYRVTAVDEHGFAVAAPPRRGIASASYTAPLVKLLPEVLKDPKEPGPLEDFAVDGMPLALGGQVQIGWHARSPLGIRKVFIWYRVNPTDREHDAWTPLPLKAVEPTEKQGRFLPELGVFENSGPFGQVELYLFPSHDPDEPSGLEAGGRFNFQTAALTKTLPNGDTVKLAVGDQVEFVVAAYDRNPVATRAPGESASRVKAVVTGEALHDWMTQLVQSRGRLEELFAKQRRVFQPAAKP